MRESEIVSGSHVAGEEAGEDCSDRKVHHGAERLVISREVIQRRSPRSHPDIGHLPSGTAVFMVLCVLLFSIRIE